MLGLDKAFEFEEYEKILVINYFRKFYIVIIKINLKMKIWRLKKGRK
jgi:hypothetical protein